MRARPIVLASIMCSCALVGLIASAAALGIYNADKSTLSIMYLSCHWKVLVSASEVCRNSRAALHLTDLVLLSEILILGNVAVGSWKRRRVLLEREKRKESIGKPMIVEF